MSARKFPIAILLAVVGLVIASFAYTTSASAYPAGQSAALSANASRVSPGGTITVTGTHFNGLVTLRIGDVVVGTVTAHADGTFSTGLTLDANQFPANTYAITATDASGDKQSITVTVEATSGTGTPSTGNGGLPNTGVALLGIGGLGVALLLGGGIMLISGRRRKATV